MRVEELIASIDLSPPLEPSDPVTGEHLNKVVQIMRRINASLTRLADAAERHTPMRVSDEEPEEEGDGGEGAGRGEAPVEEVRQPGEEGVNAP